MSEFVKEINGAELKEIIAKNDKVLVDFFATWCGPCKMLAPVLDKVAAKTEGVAFVKVDIDKNVDAASEFGVQVIPTLVLVEKGEEKARERGFVPESALEEFVRQRRQRNKPRVIGQKSAKNVALRRRYRLPFVRACSILEI